MAALGTAREITPLTSQHEQRDAIKFGQTLETDLQSFSQQSSHYHRCHSDQHQLPAFPKILLQPTSEAEPQGGAGNSAVKPRPQSSDDSNPSPDYDNLCAPVRLSLVLEEGGWGGADSAINGDHSNTATNHQCDIGCEGDGGKRSGVNRCGDGYNVGYKSGDECAGRGSRSSCSVGDSGENDCVQVAVTCEAALEKHDMGNEFSNARVGNVRYTRAQNCVTVSDNGVTGKSYSKKKQKSDSGAKTNSSNKNSKRENLLENSNPGASVLINGSKNGQKLEKSLVFRDNASSASPNGVGVSGSIPSVKDMGTDPGRNANNSRSRDSASNERCDSGTVKETVKTVVVSGEASNKNVKKSTTHSTNGTALVSVKDSVQYTPKPAVSGQAQEDKEIKITFNTSGAVTGLPSTTTTASSSPQTATGSTQQIKNSAPCNISTAQPPIIIITPGTPDATSPTSPSQRTIKGKNPSQKVPCTVVSAVTAPTSQLASSSDRTRVSDGTPVSSSPVTSKTIYTTITTATKISSTISTKGNPTEFSQNKNTGKPLSEVAVTRTVQTGGDNSKDSSPPLSASNGISLTQIRETRSGQTNEKVMASISESTSRDSIDVGRYDSPYETLSFINSHNTDNHTQQQQTSDYITLPVNPEKYNQGSTVINATSTPDNGSKIDTTQHIMVKNIHNKEDIYAVVIPKSKRQTSSASTRSGSDPVSPQEDNGQEIVPPKPPRSPRETTDSAKDACDLDDVVLRSNVQARGPMKRSTTTGMISAVSADYSNLPRSASLGYNYFSLGRRPKRPRIQTLTDSRGVAVSLEMLLKSRRQSVVDISGSENKQGDTLSVDDILQSCTEFQDSQPYYRSRTSSDTAKKSPYHPLSFTEMTNVQLVDSDTKVTEKQVKRPEAKSRPILKKGKPEQKTSEEINSSHVTPHLGQSLKINDIPVSQEEARKNLSGDEKDGTEKVKSPKCGGVQVLPATSTFSHRAGKGNKDRVKFEDDETKPTGTGKVSSKTNYSEAKTKPKIKNVKKLPNSDGTDSKNKQGSINQPSSNSNKKMASNAPGKTTTDSKVKDTAVSKTSSKGKSNKSDASTKTTVTVCSDTRIKTTVSLETTKAANTVPMQPQDIDGLSSGAVVNTSSLTQTSTSVTTTPTSSQETTSVKTSDSYSQPPKPGALESSESKGIGSPAPMSVKETLKDRKCKPESSNMSSDGNKVVSPTAAVTDVTTKVSDTKSLSSSSSESASSEGKDQLSSSSDIQSPVSPVSAGSENSETSSLGPMATLSVDTTLESTGDSSSPAPRSPNYYAKLEAVEALKWLRAAGFPQYAQMFEDGLFPLELTVVEKDHDFLDKDSLKSLFRRLETLNKYAGMKIDAHPRKKAASEEDDEDDLCALSERWEYQKSVRRWSRKDLNLSPQQNSPGDEAGLVARTGSHDSLLADQDSGSQTEDSPLLNSKMPHRDDDAPGTMVQHHRTHELQGGTGNRIEAGTDKSDGQVVSPLSPRLRRVASERIKTAKNLWKKMEGLKSKKSRRHPNQRNIVEISGPVVADRENMQAKLQRLNCVDISPTGESLPSPPLAGVKDTGSTEEQGVVAVDARLNSSEKPMSPTSPQSLQSPTSPRSDTELSFQDSALRSRLAPASQSLRARPTFTTHPQAQSNAHSEHDSSLDEYYSAQNQLLMTLQAAQRREANTVIKNNSDTNLMEIFLLPQDHQPGRFPRMLQNGYIETEACGTAVNPRTGSVRLGRDAGAPADHHRVEDRVNQQVPARSLGNRFSVYDNFLPTDGRKVPGGGTRSVIPGVIELDSKSSRNNENTPSMGVIRSGSSKDRNVSFDSSTLENIRESRDSSVASNPESVTRRENGSSCRERSVSFESSSSHSLQGGTTGSERGITSSSDSRTSSSSRKSSTDSSSFNSRGVSHSASVESYFTEPGNGSGTISSSSDNTSSSTLQQDYDEFDLILQQLYDNINDLNKYMEKDEDERPPPTQVNISTTPTPKPQTPLDLVACDTLPRSQQPAFDLESPNSPASDLLVSPTSQLSPNVADESLDLDGVTFPDNENSSSGGEGSHTAESGSDDQEVVLTDLSHDDSLDQIQEVSRERRDSGVGHSLTRAPSDRRRKKIRWHSFQRCHRPDVTSRAMQINSLTVGQLVRLQKLSLLKLTGIMEKCLPVNKSGWNWMMPRFMKRHKAPDFSDKNVFGVPLSVMAQRTGQPLPQCVLYAMRYLRRTSQNAVGIFRKSGVKSKIQQLRDYLEEHPDTTDFEGMNAYNIADMLKTFFRDLPECLLTNKMSETFRSIYTHVPLSQRLEAIQAAILLLPDENREVLQSILLFLSDISTHEADHQMNASNLAVCFTPTVFQLGTRQLAQHSPKRSRKNSPGIPDPREILEQKAAHECLLMMIQESKRLFTVPSNMFRQLQVPSLAHMEPTPLQDIGSSESEVRAFGQERIQMVLKEAHDKNRGWVQAMTVNDVEVFHRKPMDECPLKEWKHVVDIEAPPIEVLRRLMHERHAWDEDLLSWSVVERLDPHSDIFQYVLNSMAPHPSRHYCVLRYWRSDLNKGACALITMSVDHSDATEVQGVWAVDLGSYFLMEPCGSGRSRLTYITRVDSRGRTPEWYTKIFGHLCANFLDRLRDSFKQAASGPETKV